MKRSPLALFLLAPFLLNAHAQAESADDTSTRFGGQSGADLSIEAMEPTDEPVRLGMAGEAPANIARFLLARGAGGARLSPDGRTLAFSWSVTGEPQLWIMPAAGGQPSQLTFGSGLTFFRWMPDGERLIYGADNDGNEQAAYYAIAADRSREREILPAAAGGFRVFGDFAEGDIVYASTERNQLDFDIWRADLDGRADLVFEGTFGYFARAVSPDGSKLMVTESVGEDSDNLHLLDLDSGELTTLSRPDPRANHSAAGFAWLPDGSGFYFASNREREFSALSVHDLASGKTRIVAAPEADIASLALCGRDNDHLAWTENHDGFHTLKIRDLSTGELVDLPELPEGVYGLNCADEADRLAVSINGWRTPGDIHLIDLESGRSQRVFAANLAGLDPDRLIRPESIRIEARDGVQLQGLLYLPDAESRAGGGPAPVVFDVHGGPTSQSQATWEPSMQYLLDHGIAVFQPNVRGSTGFGRTYVTLDDRERRLDSVRDLVDMLAHFQTDPRIDAERAAVRGGSYGGYMVNAVLTGYPDSFAAGVSVFGVSDWVAALEIASPGLKASDRIEFGDISEARWQAFYKEISPINKADRIRVPVLYAHGVMDPRVDIGETEVMVKALRANGIEAPFVRMPDEGHGWRKLGNQLFYFRREVEFLQEQLGE
ncbi:MAG: prolyl oligopeptidase family serine peptidase [Gammaproteobacteria bacterium]|jgi:dipeptidyl aminopeptidase/acylaminoacyl peptidase|nr:prolyl oligopeptidase family serine peptidase [Gammaproteobacteria bacterium]